MCVLVALWRRGALLRGLILALPFVLGVIAFTPIMLVADTACAQSLSKICKCEPILCPNTRAANAALARQKQLALWRGLPQRLVDLFDKMGRCKACIDTMPTNPTIYIDYDADKYRAKFGRNPPSDTDNIAWTRQDEHLAREEIREGIATRFVIAIGSRTEKCKCCDDEDSSTGVNPVSYTYDKSNLGPDPKDLSEIPTSGRPTVTLPPSSNLKPRAEIHPLCEKCRSPADEYNAIVTEYNNDLANFDRLRRNLSVARQALEIAEYDEGMASTLANTPEGLAKQRETARMSQTRLLQYNADEAAYKKEQAKIDAWLASMDDLRAKIEECQKGCYPPRTATRVPPATAVTSSPPQTVTSNKPMARWTGLYGGASLGLAGGGGTWETRSVVSLGSGDPLVESLKDLADDNVMLALQVGYLYQFSQFLLWGVEVSIDYDYIVMDPGIPGTGAIGSAATRANDSVAVKLHGGVALLGRLGYLVDPAMMIYATGGPAWKRAEATINCAAAGVCGTNGIPPFSQSNSQTLTGWTLGVGIERQFAENLRGRFEYRYSDYGSFSTSFGTPSNLAVGANIDLHKSTFMFGLNYAFGPL